MTQLTAVRKWTISIRTIMIFSTIMYIINKKTLSRFLALCSVILLIPSGCGNKSKHLELPDNVLHFSVEGGTQKYSYDYRLHYDGTYISGTHAQGERFYKDGIFRGVLVDGWLGIIYRDENGKETEYYTIEVQPDTTGQGRSAEIRFYIPGQVYYDCELYVIQAGQ